ncbi:MAG: exodeoxyribonuclease III [Bacteroidia bacterium]|nr:exodeoxyribonuclease III [Bacteroidia bacterium]
MKKLISYNVNGIRSALNKGFAEWLKSENPDLICLQETKAQQEHIELDLFKDLGYNIYSISAKKKGYSGVAVLTKISPDHVKYGMDNPKYDDEGRLLQLDFGDLSFLGVYIPSGTMGDVRQQFKMEFLSDFQKYIDNLRKIRPNLIISGDYNICHKPIDINHPEKHTKSSGFLPEERAWFDGFIDSGFTDTFRVFDQSPEKYSWWSFRAGSRHKNLGWRIDYHLVTNTLDKRLKGAGILTDVTHSDHAPVVVEIDF